ncbi:hypothetical protein BGW37DRAFT_291297 [Umbelopsis sp. PMI_123]|nr:hypothetical protein BGW37DRAFT_291297 [Umbelopsis sp. PMI_123]
MKTIGKNLRFLSLCSCSYLNTVSIAFVALYCHNLQVLNISGICTVDDPLIDLASNNPQLETVNLADCNHITEKSVKAFMKCSKLKYLNIEGCHNVLGFESDGEGDLPQPEWETEEDDDDEDEEDEESYYDDDEDYEGEIIWVSDDDELDDYDSDYVDEEDDDEDYSDISSEEPITEASSNTSNINDNDGDRGFQQQ